MARKISSRLKICGILRAETPLHIGGYGESFETDMALAKNGKDEFYVPGTSLTGTLRNWFENSFTDKSDQETKKFVDEIWGYQDKNDGNASFVLIEDMCLPDKWKDLQSELRDGVGIDRFYGTAADGAKYDRAILPKGTELKFEMTVEIADRKRNPKKDKEDFWAESETEFNSRINKTKAMFGHLLEALQEGKIRLGASKTRGLGKIKLQETKIKEDKFIGFDILEVLKAKAETKEDQEKRFIKFKAFKTPLEEIVEGETKLNYFDKFKPNPSEQIKINIEWKPKSPLMVKAGYEGIGVDTLPLVSANGKDKVSLCLPGSSVKGAFRAHAERILRTFSDETAKEHKKFDEQIQILNKNKKPTKSTELIGELFGAKKETTQSNLGLGALSVDDCFAEKQMDAKVWQEVEVGEFPNEKTYSDTNLHQTLKKVDFEKTKLSDDEKKAETNAFHISHHTAIDRFTGAASDGALYSVLKPSLTIGWENLHLSINLRRFSTDENKFCALMLLLLVLRDFAENRLPLGFATNRGMGEIDEKEVEITVSGIKSGEEQSEESNRKYEIKWEIGSSKFTFTNFDKNNLEGVWTEWIKVVN